MIVCHENCLVNFLKAYSKQPAISPDPDVCVDFVASMRGRMVSFAHIAPVSVFLLVQPSHLEVHGEGLPQSKFSVKTQSVFEDSPIRSING